MTKSFNHKRDLLGHMRNKQKLMHLFFIAFQTCRDKNCLESVMGRRIILMEHTVAGHMVGTGWMEMTRLEMAGSWIHQIDEVVDKGFTLVLVQTCIMVIISIILISGVIGGIF